MNKIKFAIIGCGRIAERHALHASSYGELVAVCDILKERADELAEKYRAKVFYTIEDLLLLESNLDVVVICTPNGLHAAHTIQALRAGFHVLVEKPMAITVSDCEAMMQAATEAGKQIFTVKQNRFNPPIIALKNAIEQNQVGKLYSFQLTCFWNRPADYYQNSWHGTELDGGVLFTQFSHFIDLIYWLFGEVAQVKALTKNFAHQDQMLGEDSGVVLLEMQSGAIGAINYSVNSSQKNVEGSLTIIAEKTTLKIGGEYLNTIAYEQGEKLSIVNTVSEQPPNDYGSYRGSMSNHHKVYENLVQALQQQKPYYATAFEGMKAVEVIENIYRSAKNWNHEISTETS
ncbi:MAG: Gfo/Idh/MocA family oxidoreductase [Bacteroidota bacterium]